MTMNVPLPMASIDPAPVVALVREEIKIVEALCKLYSGKVGHGFVDESFDKVRMALWRVVLAKDATPAEFLRVWTAFVDWQTDPPGSDHWDRYEAYRKPYLVELELQEKQRQLELRAQQIQRASSKAQAESFAETKRHSHGPDSTTGKTIACIVEATTLNFWVGRSGLGNHVVAICPLMNRLLSGVTQVEEWPTNVCAEVDAMKQVFASAASVDDLVFYCWTWNGKTNKWTGKSACANCEQWIAKLKKPILRHGCTRPRDRRRRAGAKVVALERDFATPFSSYGTTGTHVGGGQGAASGRRR
jgi:hypothetical protein